MSVKKYLAGCLTVMMFVLGVSIMPNYVKAETNLEANEVEDKVFYDEDKSYVMSAYWTKEGEEVHAIAPVKEGYVFCGWYLKEGETYRALGSELTEADDNAIAKFVPAYVLSIQTQLDASTDANSSETYLRIITTVDSTQYECIGFDIYYNNTLHETRSTEVTTVYSNLTKKVANSETPVSVDIKEEFGSVSEYFAVLRLTGIKKSQFHKPIYVRPYWKTLDGTKVEGLAKYMHVEDGYNNYYSVPINLQHEENLVQGAMDIAAGIVTMKYDAETLELIKSDKAVETGRVLKELTYYVDEANGIIKFAANSENVQDKDKSDGIFANVRFQLKTDETTGQKVQPKESYSFDITADTDSFANWNEEYVSGVYTVDYKY